MHFFWVDTEIQIKKSYTELFEELLFLNKNNVFIKNSNPYIVFLSLLRNLINGKKSIILDSDFSQEELLSMGLTEKDLQEGIYEQKDLSSKFKNIDEILDDLNKKAEHLVIDIYTSGTTGRPKKVSQTFKNVTRAVKKKESFKNNVWGFAYNATHFAGLQVFFQAFLNKNTIVYLFNKDYKDTYIDLRDNKVSHLSCTPTFMKMLLPNIKTSLEEVKSLTFGGEKFDSRMEEKIRIKFPKAEIKNVYASTEAGSLLRAEGEYFMIPNRYKDLIKIIDNELIIHKDLLGESKSFELKDSWYKTGDFVEFADSNDKFRFKNRKSEMINVGGYKVNPEEVEEVIKGVTGVKEVVVFGRENSVLGNIVIANVIKEEFVEKKELKITIINTVKRQLQEYKLPRLIKFVDSFELTRTGKIKRI